MVEGRIADVGDADILPTNVVDTFANVTDMTGKVLERGAHAGGHRRRPRDHLPGGAGVRGEPFHVVHFDAHIDYMPFVHGLRVHEPPRVPPHPRLMPHVRA